MLYIINLTPSAVNDIQHGLDYYNNIAASLGFRFADEVDISLKTIGKIPTAYGYRYKNVRAKPLYKFPFLIFFTIDDNKHAVEVLRVFNTNQEPYWL